ncbi:group II intron maturase-specific domain-containing protein [Aeromonas sp. QDB56]|uniref:group II intron maturase-specific domain-containing protein n=1 Tax=Aeromonas sp. QDB56 TaxID=2990495 RepID=UPI0022E553D8|nr:group II intron maturase-specific domain-containing protein [Aeromonas sp. QDB56]
MEYQLFKTSQYLRGWIHYFGIANCYQLCVELDQWIRRRILRIPVKLNSHSGQREHPDP